MSEELLREIYEMLDAATGGTLEIYTLGKKSYVAYDSHIRYYFAVCNALKRLEDSEFIEKGDNDE